MNYLFWHPLTHKDGDLALYVFHTGLHVYKDIFQRMMDQILDNCEGIIRIADDIIIQCKDNAVHDRRLHKLMKVAREHRLVLNKKKCEVKSNSVKFFGCIYDKQSPSRSIKGSYHQGVACPIEKWRASELTWDGNISFTIHPATIFSHSNTQCTTEDWCGILLKCHISSCIWQTHIIGIWGHNSEVLQHEVTSDNPS